MNEIKKIHLSRQPFTISVDAHRLLREYLQALEKRVGANSEVLKEIESRMAELLAERGIHGDKVVLEEDVAFLKEQLGSPSDFSDEDDEVSVAEQSPKRLFRDMDTAMFGGVASGLSAFFGLDRVIIRLLFVVFTLTGGAGAIVYIILWLLVPEAQTQSDKLQMRGKAVTVDSLREMVDRADVRGAANRASGLIAPAADKVARLVATTIGSMLVFVALVFAVSIAATGSYMAIHGGQVSDQIIFPAGTKAIIALICALLVLGIVALGLLLLGLGMIKRKNLISGWLAAVLVGVFILAGSIGVALGFDIAPSINKRYQALHHSRVYSMEAFKEAVLIGDTGANFEFVPDTIYSVETRYFGEEKRDEAITKQVKAGVLTIDTNDYRAQDSCTFLCMYKNDTVRVIIHAPSLEAVSLEGQTAYFANTKPFAQPSMKVTVADGAYFNLQGVGVHDMQVTATKDLIKEVTLSGISDKDSDSNFVNVNRSSASVGRTDSLTFSGDAVCEAGMPLVFTGYMPQSLSIAGNQVMSATSLKNLYNDSKPTAENCIAVQ